MSELIIARVVPEIEVDAPPQEEIERLRAENERLRAEVDLLTRPISGHFTLQYRPDAEAAKVGGDHVDA